ncbi:golgin-45 [Molossus molossus]|uniref:Basic leucine zipper nuclear factor 1 n=1 Tax=Molossus molossus TaxID=27622 RepID=A0A7J8CPH9_MOLMO|nr:golgin-45 [Molossus molossus]KAF6412778.1 basic leucine zipper nuclear factor 1 [Molossus molossus]
MTTLENLETKVTLTSTPVRGAGDGMETEEPSKPVEVAPGAQPRKPQVLQSPRKKAVTSQSPGVLQLGKLPTEKAVEVEAMRIIVPKAAITHVVPNKTAKAKPVGRPTGELPGQSEGAAEAKSTLEKLQSSERRLLQDREGLSNQLRVQTEVNRELKKLLVASVGDDLPYHFERLAREKNQLILENEALSQNTAQLAEQLERMSIQCDVWRSKFLASRVMADELTSSRATLLRQHRDSQGALQDLLSEREQLRQELSATHKLLEGLLVSLQWGREQTYYPSAQPHSTAELAATNHKLAKAVYSHLLGNVGTNSQKKILPTAEFCSTPAEKMAETVLRILAPVTCTESSADNPFSASSPTTLLATKKNIGRFHPYTRYEDITFNCCNNCQGELTVL